MAYPRIIAHRCGGALAPENTLPGLDIAARLGCGGVEFDVMLSHDGVPLLMHDETLDRTTTSQGHVALMTAHDIRACDAGARHHRAYAGTPVPTFDEALARLATLRLWANVEIKPAQGHEAATGIAVARRLVDFAPAQGIVSSFSREALLAARATNPTLPIALLFEQLPEDWANQRRALGALAVHLAARHVTPATAQALGATPWACYTVNTRDEAQRLFDLGCSAIFTDRPDLWA
jgi:glycerophosphoryl diester phosphodiesterase